MSTAKLKAVEFLLYLVQLFVAVSLLHLLIGWRAALVVVITLGLVVASTLETDRSWRRLSEDSARGRCQCGTKGSRVSPRVPTVGLTEHARTDGIPVWLCWCGASGECETPEVAAAALAEHRRTSGCPGAAL